MVETEMKLHRCSYGEFSQNQIIGPITWPFFDLLVIHQGQVEINIDNKAQYKLACGEALLIFPNTYFAGKVLSKTSLASVQHFSLKSSGNDLSLLHLSSLDQQSHGAKYFPIDSLLIADIERSLAYNKTLLPVDYVEKMQTNLLHLILGQLAYQKHDVLSDSKYKKQLNQIVDSFIVSPDKSINIEDMAAEIHLSTSHFRSEFFKCYDEPPQRYLLRLKMKVACQLLTQGQLPIKSISATLGYESTSYFYRHFKKIMKTTPLQHRRKKQVIG